MLNFLVIGDWGRKGTAGQRAVARGMAQVAARLGSRFVLTTGDNFYDEGVASVYDPHWQASFEDVYTAPSLQTVWYVTLGNHDHRGDVQAQIAYSHHSSRWRLPAPYYAVEHAIDATSRAQFVFLDTSPLLRCYQPGGTEYVAGMAGQDPARQLAWLYATLAASRAQWKFVIGHHPIYSGSPFHGGTPELQQRLLPILLEQVVQVYFCGHEHDLQHLCADGLHSFLSGAAAEWRETGCCAYSLFSQSTLGFAAVSLTAERLQCQFYNAQGRCLYQTAMAPGRRNGTTVAALS